MKRFSWLYAILIVCLAAPMFAQAQPEPLTPDIGTKTNIAKRFTPDRIQWQPCPENAEMECGTLKLPVDYRNADATPNLWGMPIRPVRS